MKAIIILILLCCVVLVAAASGCTTTQENSIKSAEQASGAITNISNDVQDVASALDDIDKKLG